ncbi:hypothetical protein V6N13_100374 [Hibiscus sabdariffa]|uniref:Uncharacterized protein n=2 Tax=Hibiscus sabdariffa TaxID=183260 RepID=A0ABR2PCX3_9ROSI
MYGLGYDICTDDYKVVRVRRHFIFIDRCQVEILARKRDIWRNIEEPGFDLEDGTGVFLRGALHWLTRRRASDPEKIHLIVAFDMAEEKLPDDTVLANLADILCLFCGGGPDVWKLNEYGVRLFSENRCTISGEKRYTT